MIFYDKAYIVGLNRSQAFRYGIFHSRYKCLFQFLSAQWRNQRQGSMESIFGQNACGFTLFIRLYAGALKLRVLSVYTESAEDIAVDAARMCAHSGEHYRYIFRYLIKIISAWSPAPSFFPFRLVPSSGRETSAGGISIQVRFAHSRHILSAAGFSKIRKKHRLAHIEQMLMTVVESRYHSFSTTINFFCFSCGFENFTTGSRHFYDSILLKEAFSITTSFQVYFCIIKYCLRSHRLSPSAKTSAAFFLREGRIPADVPDPSYLSVS